MLPSSSGLGHRPFTAATRVRLPLGVLLKRENRFKVFPLLFYGTKTFYDLFCTGHFFKLETRRERCRSGRTGRSRKPLSRHAGPRVRIPVSPYQGRKLIPPFFYSILYGESVSSCLISSTFSFLSQPAYKRLAALKTHPAFFPTF